MSGEQTETAQGGVVPTEAENGVPSLRQRFRGGHGEGDSGGRREQERECRGSRRVESIGKKGTVREPSAAAVSGQMEASVGLVSLGIVAGAF